MALQDCVECSHQISDRATACPKCGAPVAKKAVPPQKTPLVGKGMGITIAVLLFCWWLLPSDDSSSPTEKPAQCAADDVVCLGEKGVAAAGVYCKSGIERLAKHSVKWTDGTFERKFSRARWLDQSRGEITYIGDKAEFQNGFGAFTPVIYECDMASDNTTVLDVRVREGRLP